ncbi:hypothetical protein [Bacillus chungangensis]|uniref:Kef-type K+ transport system membrane component KefB n=1 Tax=Bacillus chungangensis TaxID=587633 RepID=A0ABT9WQN3_9BACI|nr:hypothetical protein [Bacillus chungangensis]MDQ0175600.1 Kef-type K+ transport system membrane component KefB [Bacillus chungangensis]
MLEVYNVFIIPLILGIVELFKISGMKAKYSPIVAVVFGIVIGVVYLTNYDWKQGILVGIMLGLSATGLYSGGKNVMRRDDEK